MKLTKKVIGQAAVDSGTLCVVDPCYLVPREGYYPMTDEARMKDGEFTFSGSYGNGVIFSGFGGDGVFDVVASVDEHGITRKIEINF